MRRSKRAVIIAARSTQKKEYEKTNTVTNLELINYEEQWDGLFAFFIFRPLFDRIVPALHKQFYRVERAILRFT